MNNPEEQKLIDELDREASRRGGLFALVACLAVAAGLAMAAVMTGCGVA